MKNTSEIFASTIARLAELSLAELAQAKLAAGMLAFGDPDPDDADDDPQSEFADTQTEAYFTVVDLIDQEIERRRVVVTEIRD